MTRKPALSKERILDAALDLVDRDGLAGLSMRKLGTALGVEAMTLYYYVPNKDALLDGLVERMTETVFAGAPAKELPADEWLRQFAQEFRRVLLSHPGVLTVMATRTVYTAAALRGLEAALEVLRGNGLAVSRALHVVNMVGTFVLGHVLAESGRIGDSAPDPDLFADYPLLAEAVAQGAGDDDDHERFRFALDVLLGGLAGKLTQRDGRPDVL